MQQAPLKGCSTGRGVGGPACGHAQPEAGLGEVGLRAKKGGVQAGGATHPGYGPQERPHTPHDAARPRHRPASLPTSLSAGPVSTGKAPGELPAGGAGGWAGPCNLSRRKSREVPAQRLPGRGWGGGGSCRAPFGAGLSAQWAAQDSDISRNLRLCLVPVHFISWGAALQSCIPVHAGKEVPGPPMCYLGIFCVKHSVLEALEHAPDPKLPLSQ